MAGFDDDERPDAERLAATGEVRSEAWSRTVAEMEALAAERRDAGWTAHAFPAVHTSPAGPDAGDDDRFGPVHVLADNHADDFLEAFECREFPRYRAYRRELRGLVFQVTELRSPAPEPRTVVLLAGQYDRRLAAGMVAAAREAGVVHTRVRTLDGTVLGSVRHEDPGPLLPEGPVPRSPGDDSPPDDSGPDDDGW